MISSCQQSEVRGESAGHVEVSGVGSYGVLTRFALLCSVSGRLEYNNVGITPASFAKGLTIGVDITHDFPSQPTAGGCKNATRAHAQIACYYATGRHVHQSPTRFRGKARVAPARGHAVLDGAEPRRCELRCIYNNETGDGEQEQTHMNPLMKLHCPSRSSQVKSSQVKSSQVKSSQVVCCLCIDLT